MNVLKGALAAAAIVSLVACEQSGVTQAGPKEQNGESTTASPKKPLEFDVSKILYPPANPDAMGNPPLAKTAAYNTYPLSHWATAEDYNFFCTINCGAITSVVEATYANRFTAYPQDLWYPNHGFRLTAGPVTHNEQTEIHFYIPTGNGTPGGFRTRNIKLSYEVTSEANYDKLYINSTASNGSCNSPGVVRAVKSGSTSGTATFSVPGNCGQIWVGVYYIKDGSVTVSGEHINILNFSVTH